jgi:ubiquinone/menaquinone biosynthesis C-methylase UbiE
MVAFLVLGLSGVGWSQEDNKPESAIPPGLSEYMGRRVADTMSHHGAPWLVRQEREQEERCSLLLANLGLRPGMTVCDLGCGNGFHTLPLARLIGDQGQVLAVDIQPEMLTMLRENAEREGIDNITPILGSVHDPRLPPESIDLILLVDVYHEFSHPEQMLARMREALKPDGQIALVEFRAEDDDVPIKPEHKMSKEQIMKEFPANGYRLVGEFEKLPWQHLMFFAKDDASARK